HRVLRHRRDDHVAAERDASRVHERGRSRPYRSMIQRALALMILTSCMSFHAGPMPGEPKNATYEKIGGVRVRYVDRGQGPAVVLVHGFASALDTWATVMPELEKNHRVLALDLKGFGWTDRPEGDYSPQAQANLVLSLMSQRGIDKAAIVGHS